VVILGAVVTSPGILVIVRPVAVLGCDQREDAATLLVPREACLLARRSLLCLSLAERRLSPCADRIVLLDALVVGLLVLALSSRLPLRRRAVTKTANNLFMSILYK
jgi:hypothetical protein